MPSRNALLWALVTLVAIARMFDFQGLPYGNADDMGSDFHGMRLGLWGSTMESANAHGRLYYLFSLPIYGAMMRISGTLAYDLLNLGSFALGSLLPILALRRTLGDSLVQLYAVLYFALLPLLYSYCPPYAYPTYMFLPLACCGAALLLRERQPALAALCFFLSLLGYEPSVLTVLALYALAYWLAPAPRPGLRAPLAILSAYVLAYLVFRSVISPPTYTGVALGLPASLLQAAKVVAQLSATSSIFGWYHAQVWLSYIDYGTPLNELKPLTAHPPTLTFPWLALPAAALAAYLVYTAKRLTLPALLLPAAALLTLLPNALYAFTPKIATLVLDGIIPAYTGTRYSHLGFALLLALVLLHLPRLLAAPLAFGLVAWGALAVADYNHSAALYARMQASKWTAVRTLAAHAPQLPPALLQTLHAPRLWNSTTAPMSWGDPVQEAEYWDRWARLRLALPTHFVKARPAGPRTIFDYYLQPDGHLSTALLAHAPDGEHFTEVYLLPPNQPLTRIAGLDLDLARYAPAARPPQIPIWPGR